ncbi:UvrD-helicase domain-containing protein [Levilactobacillus enshiensis]|uniref:UvrD-helicase domain-containing protein n=1 Tax=Levilactobacillus enshiensis TaxID=2590213 RepID=UPI00117BBF4D|nr:UvrD-helicase domain-containing protein [Levilactobacillus enshiensis]
MSESEAHHLQVIYQRLTGDIDRLTAQLAALSQTARAMKQQLNSEGHLDLGTFSDQLETYASIEANNRQIDTLNARHDTAVTRLAHAQLLLPQAYFAKLQLDFGDGDAEALYLGKVGYTDEAANDLIYDWRAPVADAYYANRTGATTYQANGRTIPITVVARQQFIIDHADLQQVIDTDAAIGDPLLLDVLASNRSGGLQEITATIQQEQNAIIRENSQPTVIVDGVAGSGKTSVLLQRVAYQLYRHRDSWTPADILILTPNVAFSRYIRGVLPALGEAEPLSTTYGNLVQAWGRQFGLAISTTNGNHLTELAKIMQAPFTETPAGLTAAAYAQSNAHDSLLTRMQRAWRWLQAVDRLPDDVSQWLDWPTLAQQLGLATLTTYDQLYLLLRFTAYQQTATAALFVDEAQDYAADTWLFLTALYHNAALTIVGDHRQRLTGQAVTIPDYFESAKTTVLHLTTSYRATGEITRFFAQFAGDWQTTIQAVQAAGTTPQVLKQADLNRVLAALPATVGQSIGILTPSQAAAAELAKQLPDAQVITSDSTQTVRPGLNVLPLTVAKGLEFDFAVVTDWQADFYQDAQFGNNRRYVAASRGTKGLILLT